MAPLEQLTGVINSRTAEIQNYLSKNNIQTPSFDDKSAFSNLELPRELEEARRDVLEAMDELSALLRGPVEYFMDITNPKINIWMVLHVMYKYEIAKKVEPSEQVSFAELSRRVELNESDLTRFLRMAMAYRMFDETEDGKVRHNCISAALYDSQVLHDWLGVCCEEFMPSILNQVHAMVKWPGSGEPTQSGFAYAHNAPNGLYGVFQEDPVRAQRFASSFKTTLMTRSIDSVHLVELLGQDKVIPNTIVDVGGSTGAVCVQLLQSFPGLKATVMDMPEMISGAAAPEDLKTRLTFKPYNMFTEQKEIGAEAYLLRQVLHNWSDTYAVSILKNQVPAMRKGVKLYINEVCLPKRGTVRRTQEQFLRGLDLAMKHAFNGLERDEDQWTALLNAADSRYKIAGIRSSPYSQLSLIEVHWIE